MDQETRDSVVALWESLGCHDIETFGNRLRAQFEECEFEFTKDTWWFHLDDNYSIFEVHSPEDDVVVSFGRFCRKISERLSEMQRWAAAGAAECDAFAQQLEVIKWLKSCQM